MAFCKTTEPIIYEPVSKRNVASRVFLNRRSRYALPFLNYNGPKEGSTARPVGFRVQETELTLTSAAIPML